MWLLSRGTVVSTLVPRVTVFGPENDFITGTGRATLVCVSKYNKLELKDRQTQLTIEVHKQLITSSANSFGYLYNHHQAHTKGHLAMPRCYYINIIH